ncbi:MAG: hydrogenase nickel incorporation protein HypB [Proteobacteria bacterium]|nr:hydrogenase nickel incorporation protein HypB [Pseudomonadota bacterium]
MCETCGCNLTHGNEHLVAEDGHLAHTSSGTESVEVLQGLLDANDHQAQHNREHFDQHRVLAVNLMSSPGAGKTSLLEATIDELAGELNIAVIEGDLETENDAKRIREKGVTAIQICTGSACHLDAHMLHTALHELTLNEVDVLFIENVGNLICPASFDLGQHLNVALLSSPEGDDKPAKYPVMFRAADLVLITKSDLLDVLGDFDPERAGSYIRQLANPAPVLTLSARSGLGIQAWLDWILEQINLHRRRPVEGKTDRPKVQPDGMTLHAATHTHDAGGRL